MEEMATSFQRPHDALLLPVPRPRSRPRWPRPLQTLLDTHGQVWVSLLWGHCSFIPGPGAHEILFVPSRVIFPGPVEVLAALGGQASQVNVYIS